MVVWRIALCLLLTAGLAHSGLLDLIKRKRRQYGYDEEYNTALGYWKAPVELGVYINNDFIGGGDSSSPSKRTDTPIHPGGSGGSGSGGSGSYFFSDNAKRNRVPKPKNKKQKHENNNKRNKIEMEKKSELTAKAAVVEVQDNEEKGTIHNAITCQGQKEWLQCPMYRLIKINSAFWGRDDPNTCGRSSIAHGLSIDKMCAQDESNTMVKVQNACDGESACELVASPVYFDRTDCPGTYKFLRVNWSCEHSESRIKDSGEISKKSVEPKPRVSGTL